MKHNQYRLIAVDMDGTTLRRDKTIGERTISQINRAQEHGVEMVIATGRSQVQFRRYMEHFPTLRYAISSSGAAVYDMKSGWEKIISNEISPEIMLEILRYTEAYDCFPIVSVEGKTVYPAHMVADAAAYGLGAYTYEISNFGTGVDSVYRWYRNEPQPVESASFYFRDRQLRLVLAEQLKHLPLYFALPGEPAVEISMETANKGYALECLCEMLEIPLSATIAIGDSDNDLPMLRIAGLSIASGNAPDEVKARVDYVTADCDHDGVAEAIDCFIFKQ